MSTFYRTSLFAMVLVVLSVCSASALAQQTADFDQHLKSGEFTLAIDAAKANPDANTSDRMFAQIAAAQKHGNVGSDAFSTASMIDDDSARSESLRYLFQSSDSFGSSGFGSGFGGQTGNAGGALNPRGGITEADFQELMDLIQETIDPDSWEDAGGSGRMFAFPAGVFVDSEGTLRKIKSGRNTKLDDLRSSASKASDNAQVNIPSELRKVSLPRLERALQLLAAQGKSPAPEMLHLAGIYEIKYVLYYPETKDIVIAGPAGPWHFDKEGRAINSETNRPVLYLDDLVVCLRNARESQGQFGCSIDPRDENLVAFKEFVETTKLKGKAWSDKLRETLGQQDVTIDGIDPATHAGRVIVEADYRMKMVGMGLEPGVKGLKSYFDRLHMDDDGNPPKSDMARWWFTMNYDAVTANEDRNIFEISGQGVKVLSESEFLDQQGRRVHTGQSSTPTKGFADDFTRLFMPMTEKYPVYGELKNLFDCSLVANLVRWEGLADEIGWEMNYFLDQPSSGELVYHVTEASVPTQVDSVINERKITARNINGRRTTTSIVGVSGGVTFNAGDYASPSKIKLVSTTELSEHRTDSIPQTSEWQDWWWD